MTDYTYIKKIIQQIDQCGMNDATRRDEMIDHYCSYYEDLILDYDTELSLKKTLDAIDPDLINKLNKTKKMKTLKMTIFVLFMISASSFCWINMTCSNDDDLVVEDFTALAILNTVDEDPPIGFPVKVQKVSSGYGKRMNPFTKKMKLHKGVDLIAPYGTDVISVVSGTVTAVGYSNGNGHYIEIKHDENYSTRYHHLSKVNVKKGDVVVSNQTIGAVGSSGKSTGPHLHYEIIENGTAIDPSEFLRA